MKRTGMGTLRKRRRGMTLAEVLVASAIASSIMLFVGYVMLFTARAQSVLFPQMRRQLGAQRAIVAVSELLRNARFNSIQVFDAGGAEAIAGERIEFESEAMPAGQVAAIYWEYVSTADVDQYRLMYDPNVAVAGDEDVLAPDITGLSFSTNNMMVDMEIMFEYRKMRGYNTSYRDRLNGKFNTTIFPRNP